jgi:ATP-binding cassette, subfamily A (ABC1), member 3
VYGMLRDISLWSFACSDSHRHSWRTSSRYLFLLNWLPLPSLLVYKPYCSSAISSRKCHNALSAYSHLLTEHSSYLCVITYLPVFEIDHYILVAHFTISLITPAGCLLRALLLTLNEFSVLCRGKDIIEPYPGHILAYGGPILYLTIQAVLLFVAVVWIDSGYKPGFLVKTNVRRQDSESRVDGQADDVAAELSRAQSTSSGLRAQHLTKSFDGVIAVGDLSFAINTSSVFALLGPNGAGKSTTISLIRGDLRPDHRGGDVFINNISISKDRLDARRQLGVCPQFDAMDMMTVEEHLRFYATARGVPDVQRNVDNVINAVGLTPYRHRLAQKLSGGNKRKLSLGIALIGNPSVLLLDEPSSGMDAAAKRAMWRTLEAVSSGRAILVTTHSMEEADHLADRAGIMAKRMLAIDSVEGLRSRFGGHWYVHLVLKGAPHVSTEVGEKVQAAIEHNIEGAVIEDKIWGGQVRFKVGVFTENGERRSVARLFRALEGNKEIMGLEHYSISQATLDEVFLTIVGKHEVEEEGNEEKKKKKKRRLGTWMSLRKLLRDG